MTEPRQHRRGTQRAAALCAAMLCAAVSGWAQDHPNQSRGFTGGVFQGNSLDQVNLFNGALSLIIPIGQRYPVGGDFSYGLTLVYNSNVWLYQERVDSGGAGIEALPNPIFNAGFGWRLSLGELYGGANSPINTSGRWMYVGPDGGAHHFYDELHKGEDDGAENTFYTRDGSYLRMTRHSQWTHTIEFPTGEIHTFEREPCKGCFYLRRIEDRFGNFVDIDYKNNEDKTKWTLTDSLGRTHFVYLKEMSHIGKQVTQIDFEAFGGARARYDFIYSEESRWRSCKDTYPENSERIQLPFLTRIEFPDGSSFEMLKENGKARYYDTCALKELPGVIQGIELPAGGEIEWGFRRYDFPPTNTPFDTSPGVGVRTTKRMDGSIEGTWTYTPSLFKPPDEPKNERITQVVYPTGDCSKHYFAAPPELNNSAEGKKGWEYGLPFTWRFKKFKEEGRYRSSEIWSSHNGTVCDGAKLRSTYLAFAHDALPNSAKEEKKPDWYNANRRLKAERVVFHDDGNRYTDTAFSNFDGLGHYRRTVTSGDFWTESTPDERRVVFTNWNHGRGSYPGSDYIPVAPEEPWVLETYAVQTVTEEDAFGETESRVRTVFEPDTGFLTCQRIFASGSTRRSNDLLIEYERNKWGLLTDVKRYGGDLQSLSTAGGGCGNMPAQPEYWTRHANQHGVRRSSRPLQPDGTSGPYLTYDVDVDWSTGLVAASRDPAGFETAFDYDLLGRVTRVNPAEGAEARLTYELATPSTPAKVATRLLSGPEVLVQGEVLLDDFGRVATRRQLLPGGTWSDQVTTYNPRGWPTSVSEFGSVSSTTQFLGYDPFGRPTTIRPPDGSNHDITFAYGGARRVTQTMNVAQAAGDTPVAVHREWDRYGRLRRVEEASGPGGGSVPTTYEYDVGNRLTRVATAVSGPNPVTQERLFVYDNRGYLLEETHPEKGPIGNGPVEYHGYDSRGLAHRMIDGPHELAHDFDFLGRRIAVRDVGNAPRLLTEFAWDEAPGRGLGKLARTTRHHWIDLPWDYGTQPRDIRVREAFAYEGLGGAVSSTRTSLRLPHAPAFDFKRSYAYDDLGNLERLTYPSCLEASCASTVAAGQEVEYRYDEGLLSEVVGWTDRIRYHPNGAFNRIPHVNGVTDRQLLDEEATWRPKRLFTQGAWQKAPDLDADWDSGNYAYDGAGNITQIGADSFTYDAVSRLVEATVEGWQQAYTYDPFGNLIEVTTTPPEQGSSTQTIGVNASTNRLSAASYDAAGNMTAWGGNLYSYDSLDRLTTLNNRWIHLYTAAGERVATIDWSGSVSTRTITFSLRGLGNELLSQFVLLGDARTGSWSRSRDYIWAGVRLLASDGPAGIRHYHPDHLGTPRLITQANGEVLSEHHLLPYGTEITPAGDEILKFTGHERDTNSPGSLDDLDYMHNRFYGSSLGRFLRVDPVVDLEELPHSLNRYSYVSGNPLRLIDPDGLEGQEPEIRVRDSITVTSSAGGGWSYPVGWILGLIYFYPSGYGSSDSGAELAGPEDSTQEPDEGQPEDEDRSSESSSDGDCDTLEDCLHEDLAAANSGFYGLPGTLMCAATEAAWHALNTVDAGVKLFVAFEMMGPPGPVNVFPQVAWQYRRHYRAIRRHMAPCYPKMSTK